jgi:3-hydroxyisobutyrate dehydrogenase
MKIGYVGLGAMGGALARRLVAEYPLVVWDLNKRAVETLLALGASTVESLADMGRQCEVVILCLPRSSDVEQVIFGSRGLIQGLSTGKIVIDQTSGVPSRTARFAERLSELGVGLIDAPVAGGVPSALAGTVTIMTSGPDRAYEAVVPILKTISPKVYRASNRVGDGQAVKLINNTMNAGYRFATLELVALGRKLGLSLRSMTDALNHGWGRNYSSRQLLPAIVDQRSSTDFALALMVKDLNQTISLGLECGVPMQIANLARGLLQVGVNMLGESARLDDVVPFMESLTGASLAEAERASGTKPKRASSLQSDSVGIVGFDFDEVEVVSRLSKNFQVPIFDVEKQSSKKLEREGLVEAADLHSFVRSCRVIILRSSSKMDALGAVSQQIAAMDRTGVKKCVIDFTTRPPDDCRRLAAELEAHDAILIDAAFSGDGSEGANAVLCGGPADVVEEIRPILETIKPIAVYCGEGGSGQTARLIVNAVAACNRLVTYEGAALGVKFGLSTDSMSEIINNGSGWSGESERILSFFSKGGDATTINLGQIAEELELLTQMGFSTGAPMLLTNEVRSIYRTQANVSGANTCLDAMESYYERLAGTKFRAA